ncbi:hypothetical protein HPB49_019570 [Dermacentor silvarum]|uniref:Uncharacterized protein n=1 Tax=Dermacentor silvarum TaxID=543639 RepID=A0ACB8CZK5_DERSI|nr:hypothetical protein HPB49_019570 [Dermacentor silvarum]
MSTGAAKKVFKPHSTHRKSATASIGVGRRRKKKNPGFLLLCVDSLRVPKSSSDDLTLQRFRPAIAPESDQWPRQYSASGVALSGFIWRHRAGKRGGPPRSTRR